MCRRGKLALECKTWSRWLNHIHCYLWGNPILKFWFSIVLFSWFIGIKPSAVVHPYCFCLFFYSENVFIIKKLCAGSKSFRLVLWCSVWLHATSTFSQIFTIIRRILLQYNECSSWVTGLVGNRIAFDIEGFEINSSENLHKMLKLV